MSTKTHLSRSRTSTRRADRTEGRSPYPDKEADYSSAAPVVDRETWVRHLEGCRDRLLTIAKKASARARKAASSVPGWKEASDEAKGLRDVAKGHRERLKSEQGRGGATVSWSLTIAGECAGLDARALQLEKKAEELAVTSPSYRDARAEERRARKQAGDLGSAMKGHDSCGKSHVRGVDSGGHRAASLLWCRKPGCRCVAIEEDKEGPALAFRMRGAMPKLEWAAYWAQIVVTIPPELRDSYRTKAGQAALHKLGRRVAALLRPDAVGGLTRVHEFGDESPEWKPHVNVLVPLPEGARWLVPEKLLAEARELVEEILGFEAGRGNLHYEYVVPAKRSHKLRYVLRDTMHMHGAAVADEDLVTMLSALKGDRKVRYFGELSDRKWGAFKLTAMVTQGTKAHGYERDETTQHMDKGCCPACGERMKWERMAGGLASGERIDWIAIVDKLGAPTGYHLDRHTWELLQERETQRVGGRPRPRWEVIAGSENAEQRRAA